MATATVKPGYKTTEFWLAMIAMAAPAIVAVAAIDVEALPEGQRAWVAPAVLVATGLVGAFASPGYSKARTEAKSGDAS